MTMQRPDGVPYDAVWVGGDDGGVWLSIEPDTDQPGTYPTTIYHGSDGDVLYQGSLMGDACIDPTNPDQFTGWDGTYLYLQDGSRLGPTNDGPAIA